MDKKQIKKYFFCFCKSAGKVVGGGWRWAAEGSGRRLVVVVGGWRWLEMAAWTQKIGLETCIESLIG
jgi:hypothetical protein